MSFQVSDILCIVLGAQFSFPSADGYYADPCNNTTLYTNVPTSILTTKDVPYLLSGTARDRSVTGARLYSADRQL